MGRSTRRQAAENRARIVAAANDLLRRGGAASVSIADVMKAAGMTQGGFYKHFASKDALVAEAWAYGFDRSVEKWKAVALGAEDGGAQALEQLLLFYFAPKPPQKDCPMATLGRDAAARDEGDPLREVYRHGVQALFETFQAVAAQTPRLRISAEALMVVFAAMIGSHFLENAIGATPLTDQLRRAVMGAALACGSAEI